jgi:hypothetical protein
MATESSPVIRPSVARRGRDVPPVLAAAVIGALGIGVFLSMNAARPEPVTDVPIRLGPATTALAVPEPLPQPPAPAAPPPAPVIAAPPPAPVAALPDIAADRRRAAPSLIVNFGNEAGRPVNPALGRLLPQGTRLTARRDGDGAVLTRPAFAADGSTLLPPGTRIERNAGLWIGVVPPGRDPLVLPPGAASLRTVAEANGEIELMVARDILFAAADRP